MLLLVVQVHQASTRLRTPPQTVKKVHSISNKRSRWKSLRSDRASSRTLWVHTQGRPKGRRNQQIKVPATTSMAKSITSQSKVSAPSMDLHQFLTTLACTRTAPDTTQEANIIATTLKSKFNPLQISLATHTTSTSQNSKRCSSKITPKSRCKGSHRSMPVCPTKVIASLLTIKRKLSSF